jgi:hypothetical protein
MQPAGRGVAPGYHLKSGAKDGIVRQEPRADEIVNDFLTIAGGAQTADKRSGSGRACVLT